MNVNREVAENVMGWHRIGRDWYDGVKWTGFNDGPNSSLYWNPAGRIDHAWMVVEKMKATIQIGPHHEDEAKFTCFLWINDEFFSHTEADTPPMAISLAALEAVKEGGE